MDTRYIKVGMRVETSQDYDGIPSKLKGTVIGFGDYSHSPIVEFDNVIKEGHENLNCTIRGKKGHCWVCNPDVLEPIKKEDEMIPKEMLQDWDIVKLNTGMFGVINGDEIQTKNDHYCISEDYNKNLKHKSCTECSVDKIYRKPSNTLNTLLCLIDGISESSMSEYLVWERLEVDWSKVPVDTKVLCWDNGDTVKNRRYFANFEDDVLHAFDFGKTSWTQEDSNLIDWDHMELAEDTDAD